MLLYISIHMLAVRNWRGRGVVALWALVTLSLPVRAHWVVPVWFQSNLQANLKSSSMIIGILIGWAGLVVRILLYLINKRPQIHFLHPHPTLIQPDFYTILLKGNFLYELQLIWYDCSLIFT